MLNTADIIRKQSFVFKPDSQAREALAHQLKITDIRKLLFEGTISPSGKRDLVLRAKLGATVVQPCVVTLEPVVTRIDVDVERRYIADMDLSIEIEESEMPEDDAIEPLPETLVLEDVMAEALALELPEWPRSEGVDAVNIAVTEPGKKSLTDEDVKPFASLQGLRDKMEDGDS